MNTYISMLRAINVGNQNPIRMADLKALYESLGFAFVQTYVQSGNVVFTSHESDPNRVAHLIEDRLQTAYGSDIPALIRTANNFQRLVDSNPFLHGHSEDPSRLHVTFLYRSPAEADLTQPADFNDLTDEFAIKGREIFLFCPNGYGRTRLSNTFFEKKTHIPATTRNWRTVTTLLAMALEAK